MRRLAMWVLERALGQQRAYAVVGDLEEDLERAHVPRWARIMSGTWLLSQAVTHVMAARVNRSRHAAAGAPGWFRSPGFWHDVRQGVRSLRSARTFTLVALLVLSLAIGASAAIFSVVDAVVLRGLPYDESERLVQLGTIDQPTGAFEDFQAPQNFKDWQNERQMFSAMAATQISGGFSLIDSGVPKDLLAAQVTTGYFGVYRIHPPLGRAFTEADEQTGAPRVALISDGLWRRQFGADPNVIGRTLQSTSLLSYGAPIPLANDVWTIVGVMPSGLRWPATGLLQTDIWVPYIVPANQRTRDGAQNARLQITARLADGVTVDQADARVRDITASIAQAYPAWFENSRGAVRTLHEAIVGSVRSWMLLLLGAVGVVLLLACANVANLTLARAISRGREMQTRAALGASRWRIARGLLVESLVLSAVGTLLGLLVAVWGIDLLRAALPEALPRLSTVALNVRVLGVAAGACVLTGLLFGLAPALQLSRPMVASARGMTSANNRLRTALAISQIALAVVLTVGAGLFLSSFIRVANVDLGLNPNNVLAMRVWPKFDSSKPGWNGPALARSAAAVPEIVQRVSAIPGVVAAGFIAGDLPFTGYSERAAVAVPGREQPFAGDDRVDVRSVTPGYGPAIGTRLLRGRYLSADDVSGSDPVVVVNEEAASRYFGGREPLGLTLTIGRAVQPVRVVGVVGNVRLRGPERGVRPEAYLPLAQGSVLGGALAIRTVGDPLALADDVRRAIWASFPEISEPRAETLESILGGLLAQRRFTMLIVGVFGVVALAIACAGLYGVMAYLVTQRTREIGVRLALGAQPSAVLRSVVGRGLAQTGIGVAVGLAAAWPLASLTQSFLFEVRPHDPTVYLATVVVLVACGVLAAFVPAQRAAGVDPVTALRVD